MNANDKVQMLHNAIAAQVKHEIEKHETIKNIESVPYSWNDGAWNEMKVIGKRFYTEDNRVVTVHPRDEKTMWIFIGPDIKTVEDESVVNSTESAKTEMEMYYHYKK
jgi:hypothetical protein